MTTRPNNEQEYSSKVRQMACDILTINKNMNNNSSKPVLKFMSCCSIGTWGCAVDDCFIQEFLRGAKEDIQRLIEAAFAAGREKGRAEARRERRHSGRGRRLSRRS